MPSFKNARIVVTGGAGCIGSFVVDELLKKDVQEVIIVDNFTRGSRDNIEIALKTNRAKLAEGDIRDKKFLNSVLNNVDYCFHLASLKIIQCAQEPRHAFEVNALGTYNVLEACAKKSVRKLVFSSTASVYGQADFFPTPESHHPYNNRTFYGALKMSGELMSQSFFCMYGLQTNSLRYFNVFGPRMDAHGQYTEVLIRWYDLIRSGKPPVLFGDGNQTMDFIYVEDVARATVLAMESDVHDRVFNCASGTETSLAELCQLLLRVMGSSLTPQHVPLPKDRQKIEVHRRLADISGIEKEIGFKPCISMEDGLRNLVDWLDKKNK